MQYQYYQISRKYLNSQSKIQTLEEVMSQHPGSDSGSGSVISKKSGSQHSFIALKKSVQLEETISQYSETGSIVSKKLGSQYGSIALKKSAQSKKAMS